MKPKDRDGAKKHKPGKKAKKKARQALEAVPEPEAVTS